MVIVQPATQVAKLATLAVVQVAIIHLFYIIKHVFKLVQMVCGTMMVYVLNVILVV